MTFDLWDVVVVPFPFTERKENKRRPALVISRKSFNHNGHTLLAMITSQAHAPWPGDTEIVDYDAAGLHRSCIVRLKLFTLDNRLIIKRIGHVSVFDRKKIAERFCPHLFMMPK